MVTATLRYSFTVAELGEDMFNGDAETTATLLGADGDTKKSAAVPDVALP